MTAASERLWLTADGTVVVEGDPDARFLLCTEGEEIPEGYTSPKQAAKAQNKQAAKAQNK